MCFKDEEQITVGSSAYNLAGDVNQRGNFMKNSILNLIFSGISKRGLGTGIVNAHLAGPATPLNRFYKWAETSGYNEQVGNFGGLVYNSNEISPEGFQFLVPVKATHDQRAITSSITALDLHLIALEWIINNTPENRSLAFVATLEKVALILTGKILIHYTVSGSEVAFTPSYDLNSNMPFLYLYHEERLKAVPVITDTGWVIGTPPAKVGFTGSPVTVAQVITPAKVTTTVITYSNGAFPSTVVVTAPENLAFDHTTGEYTKITAVAATLTVKEVVTTVVQNEESFYNVLYTSSISTSSAVVLGVTETTTVTTDTPYLEVYWKYKLVSSVVTLEKWLPYLLKIYQKGSDTEGDFLSLNDDGSDDALLLNNDASGDILLLRGAVTGDALLFTTPTTVQRFFPVIPLRRDNVMVDLANFPTQYGWNRKATRKCFGSKKKYNDLIDSLADNPSLADIDHAWVVFGVSLSTKQQDGHKYLYAFFKNLSTSTSTTLGAYKIPGEYETAWAAFVVETTTTTNDENGVAIATRPIPPVIQEYTIAVNASAGLQDWLYNTTITTKGGGLITGTGYHVKALGKVSNCWVYAKSTITISVPNPDYEGGITYTPATATVIAFGKQLTVDTWEEYEFFDLVHTNNVYQGITTTTLGTTAIASTDENSSFIIPLHESVFSDLTLVRRTQLSLECSFIVVSYYDKQTIPWYATGFFQVVLVVVIIVIAVYTGYVGPESAGVFGTNAAVGATVGFSGTAAIVAGAIVNAVGAAIVAGIITNAAIRAFGEEFGRVVGFIASIVAINTLSSNGPFSLADTWTQMTKADNLIKMSLSGVQQYGTYMQSQAMKINAETQELMLETNEALKEINRLMQELLGDSGVDPSTISDAMRYATENPEQFYSRTTMTGTEIAEISLKLVEDFPAPQLALPYLD